MLGKSTLKLRAELGPEYDRVVVHRRPGADLGLVAKELHT